MSERPHTPAAGTAGALAAVRLDVWLDVACLYKTRTQAQAACKGGKVDVNGERAKPNKLVRAGDEIRISRAVGKMVLVVTGLAENHVPKAEARNLYEDRTPPPSPEELEVRALLRAAGMRQPGPTKAPDKRDRRSLRKLKEEG